MGALIRGRALIQGGRLLKFSIGMGGAYSRGRLIEGGAKSSLYGSHIQQGLSDDNSFLPGSLDVGTPFCFIQPIPESILPPLPGDLQFGQPKPSKQ